MDRSQREIRGGFVPDELPLGVMGGGFALEKLPQREMSGVFLQETLPLGFVEVPFMLERRPFDEERGAGIARSRDCGPGMQIGLHLRRGRYHGDDPIHDVRKLRVGVVTKQCIARVRNHEIQPAIF